MKDPLTTISVRNMGKRYLIGADRAAYVTLRDVLAHSFLAPFRRLKHKGSSSGRVAEFWALRNVNFDVQQGEVVGVIGRNGAGKSTLLKLLSRITPPSEGRMTVWGRVGSLLEVGTGFHPELTGRENIFLSGAILGMTQRDIRARYRDIVEFSEVEQFLETPVKRYSSGMYVRLAFAVAAHLEPEILLVDEVLAVGDIRFQQKCLGKMTTVAGEGRTVMFVSHNMSAVGALCGRVIYLDSGLVVEDGPSRDVIGSYITRGSDAGGEVIWGDDDDAPGDGSLRLRAVRIRSRGVITRELEITDDVDVEIEYSVAEDGIASSVSIHVLDSMGYVAFVSGDECQPRSSGVIRAIGRIPGGLLNDGLYALNVFLLRDVKYVAARVDGALSFTVHDSGDSRGAYLGRTLGVVRPKLQWREQTGPTQPPVRESL